MLFCPKCGARNRTTYNYCRKCGTKIKFSVEDIKPAKKEISEYKINNFITLKLENGKSVIYVKNEKFLQCKYLLIEIPKDNVEDFDGFMSIDDVSEKLDHSLENKMNYDQLRPEIEFWGHCSNLEAWSENNYDTSLLHSNLAFPLLKKLTDMGDPIAQRVFKDEIAERLTHLYTNVAQYLIQENYLEYFNDEEIRLMIEILFEQIEKRFKKKLSDLDYDELEALLDIIKTNLTNSKTFLINRLKPADIVTKETHMGFYYVNASVISIGFNRCGLKSLPSSIGIFKSLEELYMTENRLKYLPKSIGNLKTLKILNLSDNHLIQIPNEIGNLINLKELYLNHNVLQFLPETISNLVKLEIFSIWGNQLKNLPKKINQMNSLKVLGLSFNQLEEFPNMISGFRNLETLDLSNNKIKTIPKNINVLKSIKTIWLNNNPISTIPESLLDLHNLTALYLVNTPIAIKKDTAVNKILNCLEENDINIWK
ncbi:MAG: leucine-rich repeat domain-containing protein [Candidatus Thorarchaeota archaeon]